VGAGIIRCCLLILLDMAVGVWPCPPYLVVYACALRLPCGGHGSILGAMEARAVACLAGLLHGLVLGHLGIMGCCHRVVADASSGTGLSCGYGSDWLCPHCAQLQGLWPSALPRAREACACRVVGVPLPLGAGARAGS